MFRRNIIIEDDFIKIGRKKIEWQKIVGLKEYKGEILKHISNRFPRAEIFLSDGHVFSISVFDSITNQSISNNIVGNNAYEIALNIIKNNSHYIDKVFNNWIEWRLVFPIVMGEFLIMIFNFILDIPFEKNIMSIIMTGIVLFPFSWFWEIKSRKNIAAKIMNKKNRG